MRVTHQGGGGKEGGEASASLAPLHTAGYRDSSQRFNVKIWKTTLHGFCLL